MNTPSNWFTETLEECVEKFIDYRGKSPNKTSSGILLITAKTVRTGFLDFSEPEYIPTEDYDFWMSRGKPKPGDVLFTTEAPLGNVAEYPATGKYALAQRIITLRGKEGTLDNRFLKQYLLSPSGQRQVDLRGTGSTAKGIKQSSLKTVPIRRPPLPEQQKIADILGTWDEALEKLDALIAAKDRRKHALMQQLLTGKRRLPGLITAGRSPPLGSF
jgi:type I restriction enzyme, S subunit